MKSAIFNKDHFRSSHAICFAKRVSNWLMVKVFLKQEQPNSGFRTQTYVRFLVGSSRAGSSLEAREVVGFGLSGRIARLKTTKAEETVMLWTIFVILLVLWLLGFSLHVAGGLIHLLLVVALIVLVINLLSGRRAV